MKTRTNIFPKLILLLFIMSFYNPMNGQVDQSHPAYSDYNSIVKNLDRIQKYADKNDLKDMMVQAYFRSAENKIKKVKKNYPELDISDLEQRLANFQSAQKAAPSSSGRVSAGGYSTKQAADNTSDDQAYFKHWYMKLRNIHREAPAGADATLLDNGPKLAELWQDLQGFDKEEYVNRYQKAKNGPNFSKMAFFADKAMAIIEDYPAFIGRSTATLQYHLKDLNIVGVKGDAVQEAKELKEAELFCKILLLAAPGNATATRWLSEVQSKMGSVKSNVQYASKLHEKYLGQMLFSKKEVVIGSEQESDFSTSFEAGEQVYATIYLPSKLRKMTDSYAVNNMEVKVNNMIVAPESETAIWVTTPMQERNVLQFAILPDANWLKKNGGPYLESKLRTHEIIAQALTEKAGFSEVSVDVRFKFRGTRSTIRSSFKYDLSKGGEAVEAIRSLTANQRLSEQKLPAAGMRNPELEQQALTIMKRKSQGAGQEYRQAIILSKQWDYGKSISGVVVSRSLDIAMVSKNFDGQCMYQLITFFQQAQGNGQFNELLEFGSVGRNVYLSCDNIK
jgi:hypothetical protein